MSSVKKVVLAYSGGLDTSVIVKWLQQEYGCEVVTFTADIGQGEEVEPARAKAEALGVKDIYIDDLREEYARDYVFPMFRANTIYEGEYLLGTSIARPLIAKRLIEIANETGADAISHGATGKGNDQVRFELGAYALKPGIRDKLMEYCATHKIPVEMKRGTKSPYSMDANLLHISYEGGNLEDPWSEAEEDMWRWTVSPENAPDQAGYLTISYAKGDIVAIDGEMTSSEYRIFKNVHTPERIEALGGGKATIYKGFFNETMTATLAKAEGMRPAFFVDVDCDLFISTHQALDWLFLNGLLKVGTLVGYDDWWTVPCHKRFLSRGAGFRPPGTGINIDPLDVAEGLTHANIAHKYYYKPPNGNPCIT